MTRFFHDYGGTFRRILMIFCLGAGLLSTAQGWGEDFPGLSLSIYTDQNRYTLGSPIELIMVIKNIEDNPIYTEQGFSKAELHRALIITDPSGITHNLIEGPSAHTMPPPFFWKEEAWTPAESLPVGFVLSETVSDLGGLLPMVKTTPGWYTIEARQSFTRFARTAEHGQLGLLGPLDEPQNWQGTINSNKIQVFISPGLSAHLQVQVLEQSAQSAKLLAQVPVRVFNRKDIPAEYDLKDVWFNIEPVLIGTTNFQGWATWDSGAPCKPEPEEEYTAIAYYQSEYEKASFKAGEDGWAPDCSGLFSKQIFFGEPPLANPYSLLALNSIWIETKAIVYSGDIGVVDASPGPCLGPGVEILIGVKAKGEDNVHILGDSVKILRKASVFDVSYNDLQNWGTIRGKEFTPLDLPLPIQLPNFPEILPGDDPVTVRPKKTLDLTPSSYGHVRIRTKGTLRLAGGTYHFKTLNLDAKSSLICLGSTEIRVEGRLYQGSKAYVGPSPDSGLTAKDVVIFIGGINGYNGKLRSNPKAAVIGTKNEIKANIYVPKGTLWIMAGSDMEGSFIAKDIMVGVRTKVRFDGAF